MTGMKIKNLEPTPNPNAFKFKLTETLSQRPRSFANAEVGLHDPIASMLFAVDGVESVFYLQDFITIAKKEEAEWEKVMTEVGQRILAFDVTTLSQELTTETQESSLSANSDEERELLTKVNVIFDEMVRPALANDGGGLDILGIDGNTLYIRYQGACGTCPSSINGTLAAIQRLLHYQLGNNEISVVSA
jgi:Fe-S cluster biogenesis protein NfuA